MGAADEKGKRKKRKEKMSKTGNTKTKQGMDEKVCC